MLDVKEPDLYRRSASARSGHAVVEDRRTVRPSSRDSRAVRDTARPASGGGVSRRPVVGSMQSASKPVVTPGSRALQVKPVRATKKDRLAIQEARLLGSLVAVTSIVCTLLVIYLAAYAQVASLGLRLSQARVELRSQRLLGETLRAEVARAGSPERISAAAVKNGMVLQHAERICYVNPADTSGIDTRSAQQSTAEMSTQSEPVPTSGEPAASERKHGLRMASSGTSTNPLTTTSATD